MNLDRHLPRPSTDLGLLLLRLMLGIVFVSALLVIAVNFLVDMLYARLDPRIGA
jgi:ABC-type dipeptide/oligopeptide/nickel transport system permease component